MQLLSTFINIPGENRFEYFLFVRKLLRFTNKNIHEILKALKQICIIKQVCVSKKKKNTKIYLIPE